MAAKDKKRVLIITGMHRSGTSMVTRIFEDAGVDIGSDLVEADGGNPHGYYEDKDFVRFHDVLLDRSEQRIFIQEKEALEAPGKDDVERAEELIRERNDKALWGWKDPRTSLFLEFWSRLLPRARFVFLYRHPVDVVASLMRRGSDTEIEVRVDPLAGLRSWETYNEAVLSFFERQPERCLLCNIYRVMEDPAVLIRTARESLDLPLEIKPQDRLICREDLHATFASPRVDAVLRRGAPRAARLYLRLESLADLPGAGHVPVEDRENPELARRLETIASLLSSAPADRVISRPLMAAALGLLDPDAASLSGRDVRSRLSRAESQVTRLQAHCDNLEQLRVGESEQRRNLELHSENLEQLLAQSNATLQISEGRVAELEASHQEHVEHARDLRASREELEKHLAQREATLDSLRDQIGELEAELARQRDASEGSAADIASLEAGRARDHERLLEVSEHAENLEVELEARRSALSELELHSENLEAQLRAREDTLSEFELHVGNLEGQLGARKGYFAELELHIENLESGLEREQRQALELSRHAENLEQELSAQRASTGRLEVEIEQVATDFREGIQGYACHVENLEVEGKRDRAQLLELSKHAQNLERELRERQTLLADLRSHTENLESDREQDRALIEELSRHAENLESLRATLEGKLSRRDTEIARLQAQEANRQRELERRRRAFNASFWSRLTHRFGRV